MSVERVTSRGLSAKSDAVAYLDDLSRCSLDVA